MSEATNLQNRLIEAVQKKYPRSRMWRQNTGSAYPITTFKRALSLIMQGTTPQWFRPVKYGVVGQGDVGGWIHVDGRAIVAHIEVKIDKDKQSEDQINFMNTVRRCGGIYVVAKDLDGGMAALAEALRSIK